MKRQDVRNILDDVSGEINCLSDEKSRKILSKLLNLVESLASENEILRTTKQHQKDEINRLKGEQGKPNIRPQKGNNGDKDGKVGDHSSEDDRKPKGKSRKKKKGTKKNKVKIDRQIICDINNKDDLPDDLQFKGYETNIIQEIEVKTDNIKFLRKIYYSPSLNKSFVADLPSGYYGDFGPGVRALIIAFYRDSKMTQLNIREFFKAANIPMSASTISRIITDKHEGFHQEKEDIIKAGLRSTREQHIDDTSARVNGKNYYTQVLCNPFYTAYFTVPRKDRVTILEMLCQEELKFTFNDQSFGLMGALGASAKKLGLLKKIITSEIMTRSEVDEMLEKLFPSSKKNKRNKNRQVILEASAITFYKSSQYAIEFLVCDDAPQFNLIAMHKVLCWIHEGRHYKKLNPIVQEHRDALDDFNTKFWNFYKALLDYKKSPTEEQAKKLDCEFDSLFSTKTGYEQLDARIRKTLSKKGRLMLVLQYPFLPLHNNSAELGARVQARYRDINLHNKNSKGTKIKDTFATIVQTTKKLGVPFFDYIKDRMTKKYEMPSLASLIEQFSKPIPG